MKSRLFILGDSFVDWFAPKNHWTVYLQEHYEVFKFGQYGADNYTILSQLGQVPDFIEGDRLIIVFSEPGRLPRRYYGERKKKWIPSPYIAPYYYKDSTFAKKLHVVKYDESERWANGERQPEVDYLRKLKKLLGMYKPVFVTWHWHFHQPCKDFVEHIEATSIYDEGLGDVKDFHPGSKGCYEWYKKIHSLLGVEDELCQFIEESKDII